MKHLEKDPVQQVMVDALHRIAEAAGKETVATFIENDETLRKVRTLGIHFGQGFRLAEPQPLEQLKPAVVELSTGRIGGGVPPAQRLPQCRRMIRAGSLQGGAGPGYGGTNLVGDRKS